MSNQQSGTEKKTIEPLLDIKRAISKSQGLSRLAELREKHGLTKLAREVRCE